MTGDKMTRPVDVTDAHLTFLDDLRESGVTNMFGAGRYVQDAFGIDKHEAGSIVRYWMKTFGEEDR